MIIPFVSLPNFLDPQKTKEGQPYGPIRYKELVRERYLISKYCHTSYKDVGDISPAEKNYLIEFIKEEAEQIKQLKEDIKNKQQTKG